jgi:hypothetical protein
MNIYGIETFLIGMVVSGVNLALFIYLRKCTSNFRKIPQSPQFRQSAPTIQGKALTTSRRRGKIESKPAIICSLPIHQAARPNARLS